MHAYVLVLRRKQTMDNYRQYRLTTNYISINNNDMILVWMYRPPKQATPPPPNITIIYNHQQYTCLLRHFLLYMNDEYVTPNNFMSM